MSTFLDPDWEPTGRTRRRRRWWGAIGTQAEERRRVFRPVARGHTPANWRRITRWRWI